MKYTDRVKNLKTFEEIYAVEQQIKKEAESLWEKEFVSLNAKDDGFPATHSYIESTVGAIYANLDGNFSKYDSAKKVINWLEAQGLYAKYIERY